MAKNIEDVSNFPPKTIAGAKSNYVKENPVFQEHELQTSNWCLFRKKMSTRQHNQYKSCISSPHYTGSKNHQKHHTVLPLAVLDVANSSAISEIAERHIWEETLWFRFLPLWNEFHSKITPYEKKTGTSGEILHPKRYPAHRWNVKNVSSIGILRFWENFKRPGGEECPSIFFQKKETTIVVSEIRFLYFSPKVNLKDDRNCGPPPRGCPRPLPRGGRCRMGHMFRPQPRLSGGVAGLGGIWIAVGWFSLPREGVGRTVGFSRILFWNHENVKTNKKYTHTKNRGAIMLIKNI